MLLRLKKRATQLSNHKVLNYYFYSVFALFVRSERTKAVFANNSGCDSPRFSIAVHPVNVGLGPLLHLPLERGGAICQRATAVCPKGLYGVFR